MPLNPSDLHRAPTPDEAAGMAWWNILKPMQRTYWLTKAGAACSVADAWAAFKHSQIRPHNRSP